MAINRYNIKKWFNMLAGKSILHVNQGSGKIFSIKEIKGYYNDLTEKVLKDEGHIQDVEYLPILETEDGEHVYFPIAIFQYGLGCYDCYLNTKDDLYLKKFFACVEWAQKNQNPNGSYSTFFFNHPNNPYSAMSQGEAVSLLLRAYVHSGDKKYYMLAHKAIDFMLLAVPEGGTAIYQEADVVFLEYTHLPIVMNGWIFALFGLFDWTLVCEEEHYKAIFNQSIQTLLKKLPEFDCGYWTNYDIKSKIASPFYHNLHIAQMDALKQITGIETFERYELQWIKYQKSFWKRKRAFIKKAMQKIKE